MLTPRAIRTRASSPNNTSFVPFFIPKYVVCDYEWYAVHTLQVFRLNLKCHDVFFTHTMRSSPSTLTSLPEYLPNSTLSPTLTSKARTVQYPAVCHYLRLILCLAWLSAAEPGNTIPPAVVVSSSRRLTITLSCNGRISSISPNIKIKIICY